MRVLGIDPGLTRCGIGVVDSTAHQKLQMIGVGAVSYTHMKLPTILRGVERVWGVTYEI